MARSRKSKTPEQWPKWWRTAWEQVTPDLDNNRDIEKVASLAVNELLGDDGAATEMAKARVEQYQRELSRGVTQPKAGQLTLPGFDPVPWRPDQLYIQDGKAVRAADAKPRMVQAKAEASMANAVVQIKAAQREQTRANRYSEWFTEQVQGGRDPRTLDQQTWVQESGYFGPPDEGVAA